MSSQNIPANKENIDPAVHETKHAPREQHGTKHCDAILLDTLVNEKADGRMTSNSSFHDDAWKAAERALAGTEAKGGGARKTAESCKTRYSTVSLFPS